MSQDLAKPNNEQRKQLETVFMKSFGQSYRKMSKDQLALMVFTLQMNLNKLNKEGYEVSRIGLAMKRQRDHYHKLLRK